MSDPRLVRRLGALLVTALIVVAAALPLPAYAQPGGTSKGNAGHKNIPPPKLTATAVSATPSVQPTATVPPAATAAATAPVATATATATAQPIVATSARPAISGSATFVKQISAALDQMQFVAGATDPSYYADVLTYVSQIEESSINYASGGSHVIQIASGSASESTSWAAGSIVHETTHVKNWFTNNFPVFGCDGEAKSLTRQANYLDLVGDPSDAAYVRSLIGTWC